MRGKSLRNWEVSRLNYKTVTAKQWFDQMVAERKSSLCWAGLIVQPTSSAHTQWQIRSTITEIQTRSTITEIQILSNITGIQILSTITEIQVQKILTNTNTTKGRILQPTSRRFPKFVFESGGFMRTRVSNVFKTKRNFIKIFFHSRCTLDEQWNFCFVSASAGPVPLLLLGGTFQLISQRSHLSFFLLPLSLLSFSPSLLSPTFLCLPLFFLLSFSPSFLFLPLFFLLERFNFFFFSPPSLFYLLEFSSLFSLT